MANEKVKLEESLHRNLPFPSTKGRNTCPSLTTAACPWKRLLELVLSSLNFAGKPNFQKPNCQQFAGGVFDFTGRRAILIPA